MNEGEEIRIEITVRVPADCTREEFEEWVEFSVGYNGCLKGDNPLINEDFEIKDILF